MRVVFFIRYRKKEKLRRFLIDLKRLLRKRYGRRRYYTKGQVKRTVEQEKLERKSLWHGYLCFVVPGAVNQGIRDDRPVDMDEVLADIGEAFSVDADDFSIDMIQDVVDNLQSSGWGFGLGGDFDSGFDGGGGGE
jgi:hypothetical protein